MSFIGAVASSVRQALAIYGKDITLPVLLVGAGNFTVASVLRSAGYQGTITACDVSLYTSALGTYLADQPFEITEKEDCPEQLKGFLQLDTPEDTVASIALLYDLREVWQAKNPFQIRTIDQYRRKWPELMVETKEKLAAYKKHIGWVDYRAQDGFDLLEEFDNSHTVFAFPPTYKAGYEKMEKLLRAAIVWEPPTYREMTDQSMDLYEAIARFDEYFVVLEKDMPKVHAILGQPSAVLPRGRNSFSHIISKNAKKIIFRGSPKSQNIGPIWPPDKPVTGKETLSMAPITLGQTICLNELFLSARIDYFTGGVSLSIAFLLDGYVIGKADFCPSAHQWKLADPADRNTVARGYDAKWQRISKELRRKNPTCTICEESPTTLVHHRDGDTSNNEPENLCPCCDACHGRQHLEANDMIYVMSDLAVPSCEKRLAKLILMAMQSQNVRELLNLRHITHFRWLITTAFGRHPVSMKYRGLFKLHKRKETDNGYLLNYYAPFQQHNIAQVLEIWSKKYKK